MPESSELSDVSPEKGVRLNKVIADSGYCARRKADALILAGAVQVNGQTVQALGVRIDAKKDQVTVEGKPLPRIAKVYLRFYKPVGVLTSRKGQKTIYDLLPPEYQSVDPAGRLDRDSSGLLILSNDGDFLHQITHPRFHLPKVYEVRLAKPLQTKHFQQLKTGILLVPEQKWAKMVEIIEIPTSPNTYQMQLITGYNRQIRRSVEAVGNQVIELKRVSFGPIQLGSLKPGKITLLTEVEVEQLRQSAFSAQPKPG